MPLAECKKIILIVSVTIIIVAIWLKFEITTIS